MESRIQVLKGPFNILQLAQDKRSQFPSPGWLLLKNASDKRRQKTENLTVSLLVFVRHYGDRFHRRRAKLPGGQDRGAQPRLLSQRAE